ncbi:MAG: hypothetical protein ACXWQQ_03935 [Pseudobdellovibrio sp.]
MKEINQERLIRYLIAFFFLSPFLYFIYKFKIETQIDWSEVGWAIRNSFAQSFAATAAVLVLALPMSFSLLNLKPRLHKPVQTLLLLPQIFPVLYTVLILFSVINPFPMGNIGIILIFIVINLGLATVLIQNAVIDKMSCFAVVSEMFSISRFQFFKKVFFPVLASDLVHIFFLIFSFCFSSFSVPIVAGNGRGINLEILVYEKIFIDTNWAAAFNISAVQTIFIFVIGWLLSRRENPVKSEFLSGRYLQSFAGYGLIAAYLLVYIGGYAWGLISSLTYLEFLKEYGSDIYGALLFSFKILILTFLGFAVLLYLWLLDFIHNHTMNLGAHFISVSTLVVGFSVYLMFPIGPEYDLVKFIYAFTVITFPTLFKLYLQKPVENLQRQILVAKIFGIPKPVIVIDVIMRQISQPFSLWISVFSLWLISDFAISRAVGMQTQSLGLMSQSFLNSYRLPAAYLLSALILIFVISFVGALKYLMELGYVCYKKLDI